jgi:hypothetical protein
MSVGRGRFERATVPVKPSKGFTMMVDVAGVVPSASTVIGEDASREKSGIEIGLNAKEDVASNSTPCGTGLGQTAMLNANSSNRIVIRRGERRRGSPNRPTKLCQEYEGKLVLRLLP